MERDTISNIYVHTFINYLSTHFTNFEWLIIFTDNILDTINILNDYINFSINTFVPIKIITLFKNNLPKEVNLLKIKINTLFNNDND